VLIPHFQKIISANNTTGDKRGGRGGNVGAASVNNGGGGVGGDPSAAGGEGGIDTPYTGEPGSTETFVLCACGPNEILPMNPAYPADLFTACLTTPISMAVRWFAMVIDLRMCMYVCR
jgi:hypothetical protein